MQRYKKINLCCRANFSEIKEEEKFEARAKEMRKLSIYGIGGCAIFTLSKEELEKMFLFAKGFVDYDEKIDELLRKALPRAYPEISKGKRCRDYFLGEHNKRIIEESGRSFCLAKIGVVEKIFPREKMNFRNVHLLKSSIGDKFKIVGLVSFEDSSEYVFLDFLDEVKEGDKVIVHRGIACEIL